MGLATNEKARCHLRDTGLELITSLRTGHGHLEGIEASPDRIDSDSVDGCETGFSTAMSRSTPGAEANERPVSNRETEIVLEERNMAGERTGWLRTRIASPRQPRTRESQTRRKEKGSRPAFEFGPLSVTGLGDRTEPARSGLESRGFRRAVR